MTTASVQAFGVKAVQAIANLRGKVPIATERWNDLLGPIHGKQFTVAGAPLDVVKDIHGALIKALDEGKTLSQFRKDFDDTVQRSGWAYNGKRGWRTALIYNANMQSAYMAGRWQQISDNADRRPYLEYRAVKDSKTRPQHMKLDGTILPVTHSFWSQYYPPNGWNCRCTVRSYSYEEMIAAGKDVSKTPVIKYRDVISKGGEITDRVPVGIDPGWDHNVGQSWISPELALGKKLATMPKELRAIAVRQSISNDYRKVLSERWQDWYKKIRQDGKTSGVAQIVGYLPDGVTIALADAVPDLNLKSITVAVFDRKALQLEATGKASSWPAAWVAKLPELMGDYQAVLWDSKNKSLLVIPKGSFNKLTPTISLLPNQRFHTEDVMSVTALDTADLQDLKQVEYTLIAGKLE
jgi:SPP1 gp7 family putative phage head morphogenesis protein